MRNISMATGEYYHIYNRGVDRRSVFSCDADFRHFYEYLYLFNDQTYQNRSGDPDLNESILASREELGDMRDPYVDIASFCLRGNHFHLLVRQRLDGGVPAFLHRLGMAYTKYFNKTHERTGSLFESTYHAAHVISDAHLLHLPRYIHLNALDFAFPEWRTGDVADWDTAERVLDDFQWSSHAYYRGKPQDLPIISEEVVRNISQEPSLYRSFLREWTGRNLHPAIWSLSDQPGL